MEVSEDSPFLVKMWPRKKKKADKSKEAVSLIFIDGDIDKIEEKI